MIKLIVGLGNPGQQYEKTRHNAGFLLLDQLVDRCGVAWSNESKFQGCVATGVIGGSKVIFLKPQGFMNRSGLAVGLVSRYYKIAVDEILVAHDELDLSAGVVKLKKGGGHAGHNGLRDIIANLSEKDFYRIRVGIGRPGSGKKVADFVLSNPSKEDWGLMLSAFERLESQMDRIVMGDMSMAMNVLNKG